MPKDTGHSFDSLYTLLTSDEVTCHPDHFIVARLINKKISPASHAFVCHQLKIEEHKAKGYFWVVNCSDLQIEKLKRTGGLDKVAEVVMTLANFRLDEHFKELK